MHYSFPITGQCSHNCATLCTVYASVLGKFEDAFQLQTHTQAHTHTHTKYSEWFQAIYMHPHTDCTCRALYCNCLISCEPCIDLHTFEMVVMLKDICLVCSLLAYDLLLNTGSTASGWMVSPFFLIVYILVLRLSM